MSVPDPDPTKDGISAHFSHIDRLRLSNDFQKVFAARRNVVGRLMVIWFGDASPTGRSRLGVVASKRTFRRAVDRNRAKRLLREAFRLNRDRVDCGRDMVIIARRRILSAKCDEVGREMVRLAGGGDR